MNIDNLATNFEIRSTQGLDIELASPLAIEDYEMVAGGAPTVNYE